MTAVVRTLGGKGERRLRGMAAKPFRISRLDEGQEVLVDRVGVGGEHAMREARVELQSGILEELGLEEGSAFVRNDLVVLPLHYQRWHVDALQVLSEVRFRERLNTVVVGLGPAH